MIKLEKSGDTTSHTTVPDFESGKGYYWMRQTYQAKHHGWNLAPPRKHRQGLAEQSFFRAVDRRLSRSSTSVTIAFDKEGKRIHDETV